ncbi:MAG: hypothetical protein WCI71_11940 [Bacteroidota bacterium]
MSWSIYSGEDWSKGAFFPPSTNEVKIEEISAEKKEIIEKLKIKAREDWPDNYTTQEYWVNQQIEDY